MRRTALTIAGSDSGGGAGIQADLKTFQEHHVFGMSALTAVTAQNTRGVQGVFPVEVKGLEEQLRSIGDDMPVHAVKTGMLFDADRIKAVVNAIHRYEWSNIVVDPVMIAKGGDSLLSESAHEFLMKNLLPITDVITPNIPEAEVLTNMTIHTLADRKEAAIRLHKAGASHVVIKGGHDDGAENVIDLLYDGSAFTYFSLPRIQSENTHGTGCTFAAALASGLSHGSSVTEAVKKAKIFVQMAIQHTVPMGDGHGPTNHGAVRQYPEEAISVTEEVKIWDE
ncbi:MULTISPECIES: bifunctional hydroxymethylpyrimidine kinase/phosphomethylpyrimidine kinase [Alteribacter]|uniref:Hydroxymethylpyrimidine/phosphomethylpyrimidine kinase n=1 Tax=Alteribacter keqinensis TaxID=2483800 RepID=A0A3M7TWZ1_9BACI|nr:MULTISPECIES: bifunctional hydroxymethylpyrimidine kinase/phosphomethylpyrimidine kinase [Alteribacter]MBM7095971.1 bifunctional hydroxymethylpyrimidine kinase/phosphomethylpyrimidine kinase [Alteribacter salitolerans]RNA69789.1 bifunctional hydroxymethylpyrimidine kinase/phosphomethylpyrimidine kinase [Alteribacter keqinensis]